MNDPSLCLTKQINGQWPDLATSTHFSDKRKDKHFFMASWAFNVQNPDINRTPISKTRWLSSYQLTHDEVMQAWTSDIHAAAQQEPTGGPVFILYSTQSSSYIYRYTVLIRDYYYIAIYT